MKHVLKFSLLAGLVCSPLFASEETPPRPKYPYYTDSAESAYLAEIIKHGRVTSRNKEIENFFNNGQTVVAGKKVHFTKAMIDYMRWIDFNEIPMQGLWVYDGGAHARSGSYANPPESDRSINYAVDIFSFNGAKVSAFNRETTVKAILGVIESLPPGFYELGLPREAYPNDFAEGRFSTSRDIATYFKAGEVGFQSDFVRNGKINEMLYEDHRIFMPWYTNESITPGNKHLQDDLYINKSQEDRDGLLRAFSSGSYPEQIRYLMRDRTVGNLVADALDRATKRGVAFRAMYGDALNHIHLEVLRMDLDLNKAERVRIPTYELKQVVKTPPSNPTLREYKLSDLDDVPTYAQENFEKLPDGRIRVKSKRFEGGKQVWYVIFEGTLEEWKNELNKQEKSLNERGYTTDGTEIKHEIPTDARSLRQQLLNELNMNAPGLLDKVGDPLPDSACPRVNQSRIPKSVKEQNITLPDATRLDYGDFLERLDDTQGVLCTLGYSLLDQDLVDDLSNVGASIPTPSSVKRSTMFAAFAAPSPRSAEDSIQTSLDALVNRVLDKRNDVFKRLGLSKLTKGLNLESFTKLGQYSDIVNDVKGYLDGTRKVGPEMINDVKRALGVTVDPEEMIPVIADFSLPGKPKRTPLNIKKTKRWDGLNMGKRDILAMEGFAELVMGGTEESQTLRADAQSNFYVFGKDFNILEGLGELSGGPEGVRVQLKASLVGMDLFTPVDEKGKVNLEYDRPDAFTFNHRIGYSQTFTIGPIPVAVEAGGIIEIGLGYSVAVVTTQVQGGITPHAKIAGYAQVGFGISGFLSAGAGAEITVLQLSAPVTGGAKILFDDEGYPFLNVFIDTDVNLELLNGRVYAYVEFPIPFEIKKETMDIWRFNGPRYHHKVMSWNIAIGHQGQTTGGDMLDQSDRDDAAAIQLAISLDNRKEALEAYRAKLKTFADSVFQTVIDETQSADARQIAGLPGNVQNLQITQDKELADFAESLKTLK